MPVVPQPRPALVTAALPRDTGRVTPTPAPADTGNAEDGPRLAVGGGVGELTYADGYRERLVGVGARVRLVRGLTLSAYPAFASALGRTTVLDGTPASGTTVRRRRHGTGTGSTRSVSGFTDLPVELGGEHAFDALPGTPTLSAGYSVLFPTGNTRSVGSGETSGSFDLGLGVTPIDRLTADLGVGHYRAGTAWAVGGAGGTWGSAGVSVDVSPPVTLSLGLSGDLGSGAAADQANVANGRTIDGSATLRLHGLPSLTLDAHHAYAGTAPRWSVGLEIGGVGLPLTTLGRLGR